MADQENLFLIGVGDQRAEQVLGRLFGRELLDFFHPVLQLKNLRYYLCGLARALQRAGEDSIESKRQSGQAFGCPGHSFNPLRSQRPSPVIEPLAGIVAVRRDAMTHEVQVHNRISVRLEQGFEFVTTQFDGANPSECELT